MRFSAGSAPTSGRGSLTLRLLLHGGDCPQDSLARSDFFHANFRRRFPEILWPEEDWIHEDSYGGRIAAEEITYGPPILTGGSDGSALGIDQRRLNLHVTCLPHEKYGSSDDDDGDADENRGGGDFSERAPFTADETAALLAARTPNLVQVAKSENQLKDILKGAFTGVSPRRVRGLPS